MNKYMVVKILESQSVCLPSTHIYADVELRSSSADFPEELEVFKLCANNYKLDFNEYIRCARISTLVEAGSIDKAVVVADDRFAEILDLKSIEVPISNFALSNIGLIKELETGQLHYIKNKHHQPSMSFFVHQGDIQKVDVTHYVLSQNSELSDRYLRSLHWFRNSKHENNQQLKILFNWFAVEALLKESETDNVGGSIRWFLGFPNGRSSKYVSDELCEKLESSHRYSFWKKKLTNIIDNIRVFRNDSAHHGFRIIDISNKELELYNQVMIFGVTRCQAAVQSALLSRISTVSEFKEYMPYLFEQNDNLVNDVHGNIIFSLDRINGT